MTWKEARNFISKLYNGKYKEEGYRYWFHRRTFNNHNILFVTLIKDDHYFYLTFDRWEVEQGRFGYIISLKVEKQSESYDEGDDIVIYNEYSGYPLIWESEPDVKEYMKTLDRVVDVTSDTIDTIDNSKPEIVTEFLS